MRWLDKLERKFGRYAIRGLMTYIVALNAVVFALMQLDKEGIYIEKLMLIPSKVLNGEVWRLITYIFIPPSFSLFWILFALYFYYMIGSALEHEWGSFKFNVFYLLGVIGTSAAALVTGSSSTPMFLNLSLFFAFARLYPDFEILLFFIIPVKVKYLAWLNWAFFAVVLLFGAIPEKVAVVISLLNFFVFFGKDIFSNTKQRRQTYQNRRNFQSKIPRDFTYHRCTTCGRTEKDNPKLEFRYCPECDGDYEYCMEHVRNHEHIRTDK